MGRGDLSNAEWFRLKPHLPKSGRRGGRWVSHRRINNGVLYRQRTGAPWRDLPARFGPWKTVYERHRPRVWGKDARARDKAYSSRRNRRYLRRRQIKHTIPEPENQRANRQRRGNRGGRPAGFDKTSYKRRNEVERPINALKNFRVVATRFDKGACIFHGTVTVAAIRLWLGS
ncbi:transposase [Streptomyces roseoverticillatus]|uniref:transposase n=1 Tax=Streptomyces roseoverticillatus TaxID=66429 RepID=UPI0033FB475D